MAHLLGGALVFMVQCSSAEAKSWSKTRCEVIANSPGAQWTSIFGWEGVACSNNSSEPPRPFQLTQPKAAAKKRPAPATRNFNEIWNSEGVRKKTRRGKVYASVSDICAEMKTGDATRKKNIWTNGCRSGASRKIGLIVHGIVSPNLDRALAVVSKESEPSRQFAQTSTTLATNRRCSMSRPS